MAEELFGSSLESSSEVASFVSLRASSDSSNSSSNDRRRREGGLPPDLRTRGTLAAIPLSSPRDRAPAPRAPEGRVRALFRAVLGFGFLCAFLVETFTRRRLRGLMRLRLLGVEVEATGLENVPKDRGFVLAVNHYRAGCTFEVLAALLSALERVRSDVPGEALIVSGRRALRVRSRLAQFVGRHVQGILDRWSHNVARIPLGNETPQLTSLRAVMRGAERRATVVFPEGHTSAEFSDVRDGAGRLLSAIRAETLPVAVFETARGYAVRIGQPIRWSRRELCDLQLGLSIAALMPAELAPGWQRGLDDWSAAHGALVGIPAAG